MPRAGGRGARWLAGWRSFLDRPARRSLGRSARGASSRRSGRAVACWMAQHPGSAGSTLVGEVCSGCLEPAVGARGGLLDGAASGIGRIDARWGGLLGGAGARTAVELLSNPKRWCLWRFGLASSSTRATDPKRAQLTPVWVIQHAIGGVRVAFSGGWAKNVADSVVFRPGSGIMRLAAMEHDCVAEAQASRTVRSMI